MSDHKLLQMVNDHEMWLREVDVEDKGAEIARYCGHNTRPDGAVDPNRIAPLVHTPANAAPTPSIASDKNHYMTKFSADTDGYYTAIADMSSRIFSKTDDGYQVGPRHQFKNVTYAGAFHQMAKRVIPISVAGELKGDLVHDILEIVPKDLMIRVGGEAKLKVYCESQPLLAADVNAVSQKEGKDLWTMKTDEEGVARGPITTDGEWMFLVRRVDPTKKENEEFDETVFVSAPVMEAV